MYSRTSSAFLIDRQQLFLLWALYKRLQERDRNESVIYLEQPLLLLRSMFLNWWNKNSELKSSLCFPDLLYFYFWESEFITCKQTETGAILCSGPTTCDRCKCVILTFGKPRSHFHGNTSGESLSHPHTNTFSRQTHTGDSLLGSEFTKQP